MRVHAPTVPPQIQLINEDFDDPDRITFGHIVVETFGKQRLSPAICTLNEAANNSPPADLRRLT